MTTPTQDRDITATLSAPNGDDVTDNRHHTERIYDDEMAPLISKLINIAKANGIPLFLSAGMVMRDGSAGGCSTKVGVPDDSRLHGVVNQHAWCLTIVKSGHWQTAKTARVTSYHDTAPDPKEVP